MKSMPADAKRTAGGGPASSAGSRPAAGRDARAYSSSTPACMLSPLLMRAPKGDGHPVLTLPGFLASDLSMAPMRRYLTGTRLRRPRLEHGPQHRRHLADAGGAARPARRDSRKHRPQGQHRRMEPRRRLCARSGAAGAGDGALRRDAGKPVRQRRAGRPTRRGSTRRCRAKRSSDNSELREAISGDLPVPTTSIYSRTDGIVNWRTCLLRPSETAENIEVYLASHVGLGVNPAALWAVADRLAQAEGEFRQFDRSGPFAIAYAPPEQAQS